MEKNMQSTIYTIWLTKMCAIWRPGEGFKAIRKAFDNSWEQGGNAIAFPYTGSVGNRQEKTFTGDSM